MGGRRRCLSRSLYKEPEKDGGAHGDKKGQAASKKRTDGKTHKGGMKLRREWKGTSDTGGSQSERGGDIHF